MSVDRRTFLSTLAVGAGLGILEFPGLAEASKAAPRLAACLIADQASGRILHRSGVCAQRFSPCSTFKIPLALMGYDAAILRDAHSPAWDYDPRRHRARRKAERQRTDPASWESNSVVWYSQEIARRLGPARFRAYVDRFGYGNRDLAGNPGRNDGLTHSWLMSSLAISPDEQVAFLRRMLSRGLVSGAAHVRAEAIIPGFAGSGGWRVHGKTGSGWVGSDKAARLGWFVGWADKGNRCLVFARLEAGGTLPNGPAGFTARKALLAEIGHLAG